MRPSPQRFLTQPRKRGRRPLARSTRLASRGYLVALIGGLVAVCLLAWAYGRLLESGAVASGQGGFGLTLPVKAAMGIALVTILVTFVFYLRFRVLAWTELRALTDLDTAGETLRALLGTVSHGVILTDRNGQIRLFNPAAEILFGRLGEETLALPISTLIPDLKLVDEWDTSAVDDVAGHRVRYAAGVRADEHSFPLRILMRTLTLDCERFWLLLVEDLSELERSERRAEFLEQFDPLTGLQNRPTFERILAEVEGTTAEDNPTHALCLIDVDRFKVVNDAFGHAAGNKLLEQFGQIIKTKLSSATALARLSGDEFVALFVGQAANHAAGLCEDLVRTARNFLFTWQEHSLDVTLSVGLVVFEPSKIGGIEALSQADIACRLAKEKGRDRVHVYGHGDAESLRHRADMTIIPTIGSALSEGRFRIMAQPIQPLQHDDGPIHFEILVRMQDEDGKAVVPDHFIPAAERHILMPAVDRWIITYVFSRRAEQLRAWHERFPDHFMLAINLSGTTLIDEGFMSYLKRQFTEFDIPYPSICFEITETAAIADLHQARRFMQEIRALGSVFAVDDFGTGFASYSYLKSLPVDYLKIDGSFVRGLANDPVDRALVTSINRIGHVLGLETIAEWAETPELVSILRDIGVDYAQGFGVGKPLQLDELPIARPLARTA